MESQEFTKLYNVKLYKNIKTGKKIVTWLVVVGLLRCVWLEIRIKDCKLKFIDVSILDIKYVTWNTVLASGHRINVILWN